MHMLTDLFVFVILQGPSPVIKLQQIESKAKHSCFAKPKSLQQNLNRNA